MTIKKLTGLLFFVLFTLTAFGKVQLPSIISDNMVLQRQSKVALWGKAKANQIVTVTTSWNHQQYTTQSDANGSWKLKIRTPEAGGPYQITFDDGEKLTLTDILIGEVWVCSGQSNMERPMRGVVNQPILHSNRILMKAHNPKLRLFHVQRKISDTPLNDCKGDWKLSSPQSAASFSAVGFQFAKMMQEVLNVPVGIIEAAWGGTPIRSWMNEKSIQPFISALYPNSKRAKDQPSVLFNGMIHPIVGYGIKGFIWYQGEWDRRDPSTYKDQMKSMVKGWRAQWNSGELPFYFVQIAPYDYGKSLPDSVPFLREAQTQAMKDIPHSGMVVTMDVGNEHTIHPPDKTTVARRLLYWALGDTYHWKDIAYKSPIYQSLKIDGSSAIVSFDNTPLGLTSFWKPITGFELAGKDKVFYPAKAKIKGSRKNTGKVVLESDKVKHPVAIRYLFKDWAEGNLYNTKGLPVAPFRTDHWNK